MADGLTSIITQLERQKAAIDRALAALRDMGDAPAPEASAEAEPVAPTTRKRGMSPEGKKRIAAALKKRWAAKKGAQSAPAAVPQKAPARKVSFTPEGRKRLAEAMRRRWAVKRAGSAVKKAGRKSAA